MQALIIILQHWIQTAGGLGVFAASIVEEVISLIPSSMVQMGAGIFILGGAPVTIAHVWKLIIQISIPAALGVTIGSLPYVWLARKYGTLIIDRWGKWIGVTTADMKKLESKLENSSWDDVAFVLMRAFPAIPSVALAIYGGIVEMSWWRYITLSFIGVFIRATGLGVVGWLFGSTLQTVSERIDHLEKWGFLIGVVLIVGWIAWVNYRKKKTNKI